MILKQPLYHYDNLNYPCYKYHYADTKLNAGLRFIQQVFIKDLWYNIFTLLMETFLSVIEQAYLFLDWDVCN